MANLSGINLDPNVKESTGGFTLLPVGEYTSVIVRDELKDNNKKNGKVLKLTLQVIAGQYTGETIDDNINITNPSTLCQDIGQGTLKRICGLCNVQYPPPNTAGLYGKPIIIKVKIGKPFKSNRTGEMLESREVATYNPVLSQSHDEPPPPPVPNRDW